MCTYVQYFHDLTLRLLGYRVADTRRTVMAKMHKELKVVYVSRATMFP